MHEISSKNYTIPMTTCMPRLTRCLEISYPIPRVAPVTMATFPFCLGRSKQDRKPGNYNIYNIQKILYYPDKKRYVTVYDLECVMV